MKSRAVPFFFLAALNRIAERAYISVLLDNLGMFGLCRGCDQRDSLFEAHH